MKHLTVGIFHDDALSRELGKKNTESDIGMCSRKTENNIFSFMYPVEDKLTPKSQIISSVDVAIVTFSGMTRELGETLVMLDSVGLSKGIAITSPYATADQIAMLTKDTSAKSFSVENRDAVKTLDLLKNYQPERNTTSPAVVVVDHSFSVKGVGEVILGFVKRGVVRKYDKLTLLPANKEVIVRSIQMQDEEFDETDAGSRVGLAIKGATVEEMKRGSMLCAPDDVRTDSTVKLSFKKSPFYSDDVKEGAFHVTVGMQTLPITITEKSDTSIVIESEKPIVYLEQDTFLILDLNAKKVRIMGKAHALKI
ncbi:MAG: EF-Tu/IF-2/RF-3 family GTPase [Candidatus Bathyarchaeia archaeon]